MLILCSTKNVTSEHLLIANFTTRKYVELHQYAVKAQTSLAPLSRFLGSRIFGPTTTHAHLCCIFQSSDLCEDCAVANEIQTMKLTYETWQCVNLHPWQRKRDHVTSDFKERIQKVILVKITAFTVFSRI